MKIDLSTLPKILENFLDRYRAFKYVEAELKDARADLDAEYGPEGSGRESFPEEFPFYWKKAVSYIPEKAMDTVPKAFKKREVVERIDRAAVEEYVEKFGHLPPGITSKDAFALTPRTGSKVF